MKKLLILLGLCSIMLLLFIPQAQAAEKDIGRQVILPADHNAVVTADCFAAIASPEFVVQVLHQDPGDMCMELRAQVPGLREESADLNTIPLPNADVTIINSRFRDQHGTTIHRRCSGYHIYNDAVSTSNGGVGH